MKTLNILTLILFLFIGIEATAQVSIERQTKKFQSIDANGNGVISMSEMVAFYIGKTNKKGEPINAIVLFSDLDININGVVSLEEFLKGPGLKKGNAKKGKTSALSAEKKKIDKFHRVDTDKNKVVTLTELVNFYNGKKNKKGEQVESELMFYGLDKNKDNKLTLEEFLQKVDWKFGRRRLKAIKNKTD